MTLFFPDIASYQDGLSLGGTQFVWVKATEGTSYVNPTYDGFKVQAANRGVKFGAYHALREGNGTGQADFAFNKVGTNVPLMLDWENFGDNPSVQTAKDFVVRYRNRGGSIRAIYLPHWFWQSNLGSPDLSWFAQNGCFLVSSYYTSYSDNGPGWAGYGGMDVKQWQYTAGQQFNGYSVDFNAYRGTIDQWWALLTGEEEDMTPEQDKKLGDTLLILQKLVNDSGGWKVNAELNEVRTGVKSLASAVVDLKASGVPTTLVMDEVTEDAIAEKVVQAIGGKLAPVAAGAKAVKLRTLVRGAKAVVATPIVSGKVKATSVVSFLLAYALSALGAHVPGLSTFLNSAGGHALNDVVVGVLAGVVTFGVGYAARHLPKTFVDDVRDAVAEVESVE